MASKDGRDRHADEMRQRRRAVDNRRDFHAGVEGADHRDLREIGNAGKRHPRKPALGRGGEDDAALGLRPAEEAEGYRQVFDGQTGFLGEAMRGQIIHVASGGGVRDLDEPLLDASPEVGVDQPERDTKLGSQSPLRLPAIALDRVEEAEHDTLRSSAFSPCAASSMRSPRATIATVFIDVNVKRFVHRVNTGAQQAGKGPRKGRDRRFPA